MKIVCINNKPVRSLYVEDIVYPLTINKIYDTNRLMAKVQSMGREIDFEGNGYYPLVDDNKECVYYNAKLFIPLEEYRIKQIDKLL